MTSALTPTRGGRPRRVLRMAAAAVAISLIAAGCGGRSEQDFAAAAGGNSAPDNLGVESTITAPDAPSGKAQAVPRASAATVPDVANPGTSTAAPAGNVKKPKQAGDKKPTVNQSAAKPAKVSVAKTNLAATAARGLPAITNCKGATGTPVLLGNIGNYAGVMGGNFISGLQSLQLFVKVLNDCNGLNGHPIQLFVADDQGDPTVALTHAKEMVESTKVIAFVGNFVFLSWSGFMNYLDSKGIPMIGGDAYNDIWYRLPMAFPTHPDVIAQITALVRSVTPKDRPFNGGSIYCNEQPICEKYAKAGAAAMKANGGSVVVEQSISLTQPSFIAQCNSEKQTKAEFVISGMVPKAVERWARNCESIDYKPHVLTIALGAQDTMKDLPSLGGMDIGVGEFGWTDTSLPGTKAFHDLVAKYNPRLQLGGAASVAWVAGLVLQEAGKALGAQPTTADLLKGLYAIQNNNFGGLSPTITYKPGPHPSSGFPQCVFLMGIRGGQWQSIQGGQCV